MLISVFSVSLTEPEGGGGGAGGPDRTPPPLKNHKYIGFLSNTGPDPLNNHSYPASIQFLAIIGTLEKRHFAGGPMMALLLWFLEPPSPHQLKAVFCQIGPLLMNLTDKCYPFQLCVSYRLVRCGHISAGFPCLFFSWCRGLGCVLWLWHYLVDFWQPFGLLLLLYHFLVTAIMHQHLHFCSIILLRGGSRISVGFTLLILSHFFFLNIPWKWNNLVSLRPNYFIFIVYFKRGGGGGGKEGWEGGSSGNHCCSP